MENKLLDDSDYRALIYRDCLIDKIESCGLLVIRKSVDSNYSMSIYRKDLLFKFIPFNIYVGWFDFDGNGVSVQVFDFKTKAMLRDKLLPIKIHIVSNPQY